MLDIQAIRKDFPVLTNNPDLVYLDSTATSLKPKPVIEAITEYYTRYSANIHRGVYKISEKATAAFEDSRTAAAGFVGAATPMEIIFTRGTTEGLNLLAYSLAHEFLNKGDEIVTTIAEHHANFVPWQQLSKQRGATFTVVDIVENGVDDVLPDVTSLILAKISNNTKILSLTYISNVLGTVLPLKNIIETVKKKYPHVIIIVDAAQAAPHIALNVQELGCDFLVFSAHKMCGPTGVGVLWGRHELLQNMTPFLYGGDMIEEVHRDTSKFREAPYKFEAGTPHISGVIALKAAIDYLQQVGLSEIEEHEKKLTAMILKACRSEFGDDLRIVGHSGVFEEVGVVAMDIKGCHPHDIAQILDDHNVAVRAGNHCAMPLHTHLGLMATIRASLYLYTTEDDVAQFIEALKKTYSLLH